MQKQHELNLRRHNSLLFLGMISNLKLIERYGTKSKCYVTERVLYEPNTFRNTRPSPIK